MKVFKKMDEMQLSINLTSVKFAWVYTVIFLFIWSTYDFIKTGSYNNSLAFFLLISQNLIYICIHFFLNRKMNK
ncbi:hypothetical protein SAMN05421842_12951 [Clostridium uliginosum]|uniref:Uncharacterized protein n=1 Tax=Clostridium uliginosum TaxID=119641 RepID=A0A1I1R2R4_9CLOT|nr:hypothetical protein SAMN05421842_12951 [Clostridium uliginosum]